MFRDSKEKIIYKLRENDFKLATLEALNEELKEQNHNFALLHNEGRREMNILKGELDSLARGLDGFKDENDQLSVKLQESWKICDSLKEEKGQLEVKLSKLNEILNITKNQLKNSKEKGDLIAQENRYWIFKS